MRYLYSLFIFLYDIALHVVSPFNPKVKQMLKGRKLAFVTLREKIVPHDKVLWFHLASLGEFEQGRPLIAKCKVQYPKYKILLTFFSPSGYQIRKNYPLADCVIYLPSDSRANARQFMRLAHPQMAFFVKYEFWYNFIIEAKACGAKIFQVSLIFRQSQYFFKPYGRWFANKLRLFDYFFVQNQETQQLLASIGIKNATISGDTRFDRVTDIVKGVKSFDIVKQFCDNKAVVLMGSSWPKDEELMLQVMGKTQQSFKLIIVPHETEPSHIKQIQQLFPSCVLYTDLQAKKELNPIAYDILVINCVGILSSLYQYATIAYIGGGFGVGIHNTLEAATFGKPIVFGTNYQKFQEAVDLLKQQGAFSVKDSNELFSTLDMLMCDKEKYNIASQTCANYVSSKAGAVNKILSIIEALDY